MFLDKLQRMHELLECMLSISWYKLRYVTCKSVLQLMTTEKWHLNVQCDLA